MMSDKHSDKMRSRRSMLSHLSGIAVAGSVSSTAVGAATGEGSQSSNELPKDAGTNISVKEINGERKKELITKVGKMINTIIYLLIGKIRDFRPR